MARRAIMLALAAVLGIGALGIPSMATDRGAVGPMTPDNRHISNDYPPLVGQYPAAGVNPFAAFRPPACGTATYCDAFVLRVEYPDPYIRNVFFAIDATLSWENPRTEENQTGNDLDLFLWPDDDPTSGGPSSKCAAPTAPECNNLETETITITEPSNTEKPDTNPIFFTVVNHSGVNTGYTMTFDWYEFDVEFEDFVEFEPPQRDVTSSSSGDNATSSSGSSGPSGPSLSGPQGVQGPGDGERKVVVPGPDGELVEMDLPVLAAGEDLERQDSGGLLGPWAWVAIAVILLGSGAAFFVLHRQRRAAEGDLY